MKLFSIILFSLLIFVGKLSMASFIVNPEALNRFKHKINYTAITAKLPQDGLGVYLDWEDTLSHLLTGGTSWEAEDRSTTITFPFHAETSLSYEKDDARIKLEVHLFSDLSNTEVLDEALAMMSRTTMMDINKVFDKNGPCDVFFYSPPSESGRISHAYCVFRNVIARVDTYSKDIDVRPVLEILYKKMKPALVNITDFKPVIMSCTVSSEVVSIGEEFYIDVISKDESYIVELHLDFDEELDVLDIKKRRFNFKALQQGTHTISISVLDPKTLLSTNIQKFITVK